MTATPPGRVDPPPGAVSRVTPLMRLDPPALLTSLTQVRQCLHIEGLTNCLINCCITNFKIPEKKKENEKDFFSCFIIFNSKRFTNIENIN